MVPILSSTNVRFHKHQSMLECTIVHRISELIGTAIVSSPYCSTKLLFRKVSIYQRVTVRLKALRLDIESKANIRRWTLRDSFVEGLSWTPTTFHSKAYSASTSALVKVASPDSRSTVLLNMEAALKLWKGVVER